jgi:ABC-type transport system involved in multi-copper enzyme maturation permease subunit
MQALFAIARLTFKAAFRFRLVPLLGLALIGAVFLLPAAIKHDGTAQGLTQIVLTYTLGLTTGVLGLTTLWLACGTLARDIEDFTIQTVAVKPVARWQIWLGKWLGILALNVLLLGGAAVLTYVQLVWRARHLPAAQQEVLRNEVFTARASFKEPPPDLDTEVERRLQQRLQNQQVAAMERGEARKIIRAQVKAEFEEVPSGHGRTWRIDLSRVRDRVRDQPLFARVKFYVNQKSPSGNYQAIWEVGPLESPNRQRNERLMAAETFYEIQLPPGLLDEQGILRVDFLNANETSLLFPLDEGFEILYREGSFALNYARGVAILLCWLALLAAVGLAAASYLAFPVAAFVAFSMLVVVFSTGTMNTIIEQGGVRPVNANTGVIDAPGLFDQATVAFFKGLRGFIHLASGFSPVEALSTGRSITWGTLARAVLQIVVVIGGLFAAAGMVILTRRELAVVSGKG